MALATTAELNCETDPPENMTPQPCRVFITRDGASIQPTRSPGATSLEKELTETTRSPPKLHIGGGSGASAVSPPVGNASSW